MAGEYRLFAGFLHNTGNFLPVSLEFWKEYGGIRAGDGMMHISGGRIAGWALEGRQWEGSGVGIV